MVKRLFDIVVSFTVLLLIWPFLLLLFIAACFDTGLSGLFTQDRVGRYGRLFSIYKIRTINSNGEITRLGKLLRSAKADELPQFFNILIGDMSLVGPRPDLPGYYDALKGKYRKLLQLRPGLTGPASLKYANEDELLAQQDDPLKYNDEVIFPDKIRINMQYLEKHNFWYDLKIMLLTITGGKIND